MLVVVMVMAAVLLTIYQYRTASMQATGPIPSEIGLLKSLTHLTLGEILVSLQYWLCHHPLLGWYLTTSPPFSKCFFRTIFTAENALTGVIPTELRLLTDLSSLYLGMLFLFESTSLDVEEEQT
jgi:hypothetical protein